MKYAELAFAAVAFVALIVGGILGVEWSPLVASLLGGAVGLVLRRPSESLTQGGTGGQGGQGGRDGSL